MTAETDLSYAAQIIKPIAEALARWWRGDSSHTENNGVVDVPSPAKLVADLTAQVEAIGPDAQAAAATASAAAAIATAAADNAQASARTAALWTTLATYTPTVIGEGAEVLDSDAGTHTDPQTSATVANAGRYTAYATTVGAWTRIGDTGLSGKASNAALADEVATREKNDAAEALEREAALPRLPYNTTAAWAVFDADGKVAIGVDETGAVIGWVPTALAEMTSDTNAAVSTLASQINASLSNSASVAMPYTGIDMVWGVTDRYGVPAIALTADGKTRIVRDGEVRAAIYSTDEVLWGIIDDSKRIAIGVTKSGTVVGQLSGRVDDIAGRLTVIEGIVAGENVSATDAQPVVYTRTDGTFQQIFAADADGEFAVTPDEYDAYGPVALNNTYVKFMSDMDGARKLWRKPLYGSGAAIKSYNGRLDHILIIGQSNTIPKVIAHAALPSALTVGEILPGACLQFNGNGSFKHPWPNFRPAPSGMYPGAWDIDDQDAEILATEIDHFVNLEGQYLESHAFGFGELINSDDRLLLFSGHGRGSGNYAILKKGLTDTTNYAYRNSITAVTRAKALANSLGLEYRVIGMLCEHGEGDSQNAAYLSNLNEWIADYNADIKAITGQAEDVPLYLTQHHSWSLSGTQTTSKSVIAQLDVHEQNPLGMLVAPKYFLPHDNQNAGVDDGVHLSAYGIRTLSEYYAKAWKQNEAVPNSWNPLRPSSVVFDGTATITVSFAGRVGDLRFSVYDATTNPLGVADPGNYGFELADTGGATITAVALSVDATQVLVTVSQPLADGAMLRYAYTNVGPSNAGPLTGPRGCLCDSDPTPPSAKLQAHRAARGMSGSALTDPLKNWCVTFSKLISI
ncbi:hypothetical protein [Solimonas flava]|uniref:hypothetical protein n=1 Tax=Solimonas flava TaxID=415849 RepID=UPI000408C887|nr:hypothetical protein [Solimonas flava]